MSPKNLEIHTGQDKTRVRPKEEAGSRDAKVPVPGALCIRSVIVLFPIEVRGVSYTASTIPNLVDHVGKVMDSLGLNFSYLENGNVICGSHYLW